MTTDLLGAELTEEEAHLMRLYGELKLLVARPGLAPATRAAALAALAPIAVAVTDLGLAFEHLIDVGA
ncbi:hypothetical protein [Microbacterium album]|uniref:Uncharacterized protein n=1 Tax=Microbacterium album TaxID=2053191 RepID=A0A917IH05_9MICO|nr:hypothetical protein [Microbacterium album]GGH43054.1 hypothetical protein GCM10010921_16700 [Microbacterium album]